MKKQPSSVTSIGDYAFSECENLTSITIPSSVTSIGLSAFEECSSLTLLTVPSGVTSIGDYAFSGCTSLTSVAIPDSVTSIGDEVFSDCTSLVSITVSVSSVDYASSNGVLFDKGLTELIQYPAGKTDSSYTVPSSVTSLGDEAFEECKSLKNAIFQGAAPSVDDGVFDVSASGFTISYYPGQSGWSTPRWHGYPAFPIGSTNAYLSKRTASTGSWNYKFSKTRYSYKLTISRYKSSAKVTVAKADSTAKILWSYDKSHWYSGSYKTVKVSRGNSKYVYFKVVSQSSAKKIYAMKVYRKR